MKYIRSVQVLLLLTLFLYSCTRANSDTNIETENLKLITKVVNSIESKDINEFSRLFSELSTPYLNDYILFMTIDKANRLLDNNSDISKYTIVKEYGSYDSTSVFGQIDFISFRFEIDSITYKSRCIKSFLELKIVNEQGVKKILSINVIDANEMVALQSHLDKVNDDLELEKKIIIENLSVPFKNYSKITFAKSTLDVAELDGVFIQTYVLNLDSSINPEIEEKLKSLLSKSSMIEFEELFIGDINYPAQDNKNYFLIQLTVDRDELILDNISIKLYLDTNTEPRLYIYENTIRAHSINSEISQEYEQIMVELLKIVPWK